MSRGSVFKLVGVLAVGAAVAVLIAKTSAAFRRLVDRQTPPVP